MLGLMDLIQLKAGEYFSQEFLPAGIVYKSSTGIGATEHELNSPRYSIVISPLIAILKSKEKKGILTLSSEFFKDPSFEAILNEYFSSRGPKFKKIHTTIESLWRLLKPLKKLGFDMFKDFHFMLDEAHMFQMESNYRHLLPIAFEYYKRFPASQRTCISASLYKFSDPVLQQEQATSIVRADSNSRTFETHLTNDPLQKLGFILANVNDNAHIFVDSIDYALQAIKMNNLKDAVIFCGEQSKEKADVHYAPFNSNPTNKYCFYTSAYFTGCDIYAKGTQILITGENPGRDYRLTKSDLIQCLGRMRNGASQCIVIATHGNNSTKAPKNNAKILLSMALTELKRFSARLKKAKKLTIQVIKERINKSKGFIMLDLDSNPVINYPLIDRRINREMDLYDLYRNSESMKKFLEHYGSVKVHQEVFKGPVRHLPKVGKKSKSAEFSSAFIKISGYEYSIDRLKETSSSLFDPVAFDRDVTSTSTGLERKFLVEYRRNPDLNSFAETNGDFTKFQAARIRRLVSEDVVLFKMLERDLPVGKRITTSDLLPIVKRLLAHILMNDNITTHSVKKWLRHFREFKNIQLTHKKHDGVLITG